MNVTLRQLRVFIEVARLQDEGILTDDDRSALESSVQAELDEAVAFGRASPYPAAEDLWSNMYADSTAWEERPWPR